MEPKNTNKLQTIDNWISFLYLFTRKVKNYSIQDVYKEVVKRYPYSKLFDNESKNANYHFEQFREGLLEVVSSSKNINRVLLNIKNRTEPTIRKYKEWYETNKTATRIFEPYNPYNLMFEYMIYTEKEIELYFKSDKNSVSIIDSLPPLPDCLVDKDYFFNVILKHPKVEDHYTILKNGSFKWTSLKSLLGGFAVRLNDTGKINNDIINTNQDLARIFCPFFNVSFDPVEEKSFQHGRAKIYEFQFIK
jgi:hypothetical protein